MLPASEPGVPRPPPQEGRGMFAKDGRKTDVTEWQKLHPEARLSL